MRKSIYLLMLVLLLFSCGQDKTADISQSVSMETAAVKLTADTIVARMENAEYAEGELLVKFKTGAAAALSAKTHQAVGASVMKSFTFMPDLQHVKLPDSVSVKDAVVKYMADPNVQYAEPNYIRRVSTTIPNDPFFSQQWGLRNTGQFAGGAAGADIKAADAWDYTKGSHSIVIAVLDTGIDFNHPDLGMNICLAADSCAGWNYVSNNNNPADDYGHGTLVSGIIGAVGNNALGMSGVMWNVKIMPVKFMNSSGIGYVTEEVPGILYAIAHGARVINASFGGSVYSQTEYDALSSANAAGVLVIAAAGNDSRNNDFTPVYPASYGLPNIISVAATDQSDNKASFSNFGVNSVHVGAPGVYILGTFPRSMTASICRGGATFSAGYDFCSGTSMAAPHISALAGLLYSYYTSFTHDQIRLTIFRYVDVLGSLSRLIGSGGRINAYRAITALLAPTGMTAAAASSSQIIVNWIDNATGEDGYKLERATASTGYTQIATPAASITSYTDNSVIDGTTYVYRARAYNSIGDGFYGNETSATTPLNKPTNLSGTTPSSTQVQLTWTDNSQSEDGIAIERSSSGPFAEIARVGSNVNSYTDSTVSPSTVYEYRIRAFNSAAGFSSYSNTILVTTPSGGGGGGGGGGGCSLSATHQDQAGVVDIMLVTMPLIVTVLLLRRRR